jgi:hypothetical protein
MSKFLFVQDQEPYKYGMRSGLVYRGKNAYFIVTHRPVSGHKGFFHLGPRLGEISTSVKDILQAYCAHHGVPPTELEHFHISPLRTRPGARYGRIMRPLRGHGVFSHYKLSEIELRQLLDEYAQLDNFMRRFEEITRVIYPDSQNLGAYGFEIRSLLILACTEVELLFKRLLWNETAGVRGNMPIFFKGAFEAKLPEYHIKFNFYPQLNEVRPFGVWSKSSVYVPLDWYQAYNATKHNRHSGVEEANLSSLIHALAACAVLLRAQTANLSLSSVKHPALERFSSVFSVEEPQWMGDEHYWVLPNRPLKILPVPGIA